MTPNLDPWVLLRWLWLTALTVTVAHALAAGFARELGLLHLDVAIQVRMLVVNVGFMLGVFGPLFEPAIADELGWGERRRRPWRWQAVRILALAAVLIPGLLIGREIGPLIEALIA